MNDNIISQLVGGFVQELGGGVAMIIITALSVFVEHVVRRIFDDRTKRKPKKKK